MRKLLLALLVTLGLVVTPLLPSAYAGEKPKKDKSNQDAPLPDPKNLDRDMTRFLRDLQFALEGSSVRGFLNYFDANSFSDYSRFEDMVERLMREDTLRVHFRPGPTAPPTTQSQISSQLIVDADLELAPKGSFGRPARRRQQLVVDLQYMKGGWKVVNISPRSFFQPL